MKTHWRARKIEKNLCKGQLNFPSITKVFGTAITVLDRSALRNKIYLSQEVIQHYQPESQPLLHKLAISAANK